MRDKGRDGKMDEEIVEKSKEGDIEGGWRDIWREDRWRNRGSDGGWTDRKVNKGIR